MAAHIFLFLYILSSGVVVNLDIQLSMIAFLSVHVLKRLCSMNWFRCQVACQQC